MTDTEVLDVETPEEPRRMEDDLSGKLGLAALLLGIAALGFYGGWPILVVVLSLVFMIFMHELGHYLTAKSAGMKVTEFFLGFGPRIWSFRKGETEYGIKLIWAGAYVKIIGMNNLEEVDPADEPRTYRQKSYPRRMSVAVAGSAMHFLMALVLAFVALVGYGVHNEDSARNWTVGVLSTPAEVEEQFNGLTLDEDFQSQLDDGLTPATAAGLEEGDRVVAVNGEEIDEFADLRDFIQDHPGEDVTFTVERGDETFDTETTLGEVSDGQLTMGFLGLGHEEPRQPLNVFAAARESVSYVGTLMGESVKAIGHFFTPSGLTSFYDSVVGNEPTDQQAHLDDDGVTQGETGDEGRIISIVGAARLGAQATDSDGLFALLNIMVVLNVFIGLFNLIPLLPFDGGHVAIGTYERIREIGRGGQRYQADLTRMLPVAYAVVMFMVTIGMMALYADIADPINFPG